MAIQPGSVKICGIRTAEHALVASRAGAELVGMIFAPARRQVTVEMARQISDVVHAASLTVRMVGVFVDARAAEINRAAVDGGLDVVQLNGDESPQLLSELRFPAIKAFRPLPGERAEDLVQRIRLYLEAAVPPIAILIDGFDPKAHGGTGVRADWGVAGQVSTDLQLAMALAGGLTPENVGEAVSAVRPVMVDTSSGVEVDGLKDDALIRRFIERADAAFAGDVMTSELVKQGPADDTRLS